MVNKVVGVLLLMSLIVVGGCTTDLFHSPTGTKPRFPVKKFVSQQFVEGWPVVEAYRYGSDDHNRSSVVDTLEDIVEDPGQKSVWAHSVATLGLIGGEKAGKVIAKLVKMLQELPSLSLYEQRAMHSGLVALGSWAWTSKHRPGLIVEDPHIESALRALKIVVKNCGKFNSIAIMKQGFSDLTTDQKQMKDLNRAPNAKSDTDDEKDAIKKTNGYFTRGSSADFF